MAFDSGTERRVHSPDAFPIVKRKDAAAHGRYRTKEAILEIYDAMTEAIRTGVPYRTKLDPPPANGWVPSEASSEWGVANEDSLGTPASRRPRNGAGAGPTEIGRRGSKPLTPRHSPLATPGQGSLDLGQDGLAPGEWVSVDGRGGLLTAVRSENGTTAFTVLLEHEESEKEFVSPPAEVRRSS